MPNTTNFNWTTPADTDLVKDGALAIRTLANGIDTSLVDLKGGTTGQFLSKASNTDLDFTFATITAGGMTLLSTTTLSGTSTTISTINQTYNDLLVIINNPYVNSADTIRIDPNSTNSISPWSGTYNGLAYTDNTMYSVVNMLTTSTATNALSLMINQYANTSYGKPFRFCGSFNGTATPLRVFSYGGNIATTSAITEIKITTTGGTSTFSGGQVLIYGVK